MKYGILTVPLIFLMFSGCDFINPEEQAPAFLKIDAINLDASSNFSSNSNNVSDVWVYVDSRLVGAWELPAEIPIMAEGSTKIRLVPGIYKDGIKSHHHFYPFYSNFDTTLNLVPGQVEEFTPDYVYTDNFNLIINEDFESATMLFQAMATSDSVLLKSSEVPIDGLNAGIIYASGAGQKLGIESIATFTQPIRTNIPTYLEMDYISTVVFNVGVTINGVKSFELALRPNTTRKKVYIDLSSEIGVYNVKTNFKLFIEGTSTKALDYIAVDNLRLLAPKE